MKLFNRDISLKQLCIICAIVTATVLVATFFLILHINHQSAPIYEINVKGLAADTPQDAQAQCRTDHEYYASLLKPHKDCFWVWGEEDRLYALSGKALGINPDSGRSSGFTYVDFRDRRGIKHSGYIIDPTVEPVELARVSIAGSESRNIENVSMSIRDSIRRDILQYENAAYVWEKGQSFVYVLKKDAVTKIEGAVCSFKDDGSTQRVGFLIDTRIG